MTELELKQQAEELRANGYCILELAPGLVEYRAEDNLYTWTGDTAAAFLDYVRGLQQNYPGLSRIDAALNVAEWFFEDKDH